MNYAQCLTETRIGQEPKQKAELLEMLKAVPCYAKMASKLGVLLVARNRQFGPRIVRCLCLELGEQCVPVLKNKLNAKPARSAKRCKHCNEIACSRKTSLGVLRFLISDQIEDARSAHAKAIVLATKQQDKQALHRLTHCPLTGKTLFGATHVDHKVPFSKLVEQWAEQCLVNLCQQKLAGRGQTKIFADGNLNESWQEWHEKHAMLQIVIAKANLSKGAKC